MGNFIFPDAKYSMKESASLSVLQLVCYTTSETVSNELDSRQMLSFDTELMSYDFSQQTHERVLLVDI